MCLWSNDFTSWHIHGGEGRHIGVSVEKNPMQLKCMINYEDLRIFTSWPINGGEDRHVWVYQWKRFLCNWNAW